MDMASTWHEHRAGTIRASRHTTAHKRHYVAQGCSGCGHAHRARSPPPNATPAKASVHASLSLSARVRRSGAGGAPSYDRRAPAEGWSSLLSRLPRRRRTGPGATAPQGTGPGATAPQRRQRGRRQRWCASGAASRGVRLARIGPAEVPGDSLVMREKEIRVREAEETELVRGGELLRRRPARGGD